MLPDLSSYLVFLGVALAMLVTPGPAVLYIVARSLEQGRRAGVASSLGIGAGGMVHVTAATLGLSAVLAASAQAFLAVKIAGGIYLVWLGVRTLTGAGGAPGAPGVRPRSLARVFRQGVVVQILNPKPAVFFLALLPQFVDPARGHATLQILCLGMSFVGLAVITDTLYALAAGSARRWLARRPGVVGAQRWIAGTVYVGLGLATALGGTSDD